MKYRFLAPSMLILFSLTSFGQTPPQQQCVQIKEKCKLNLKQTKWGFKLGGVDFKSGPVSKVGEVSVGTDLIQQMTPIAQLLDQMQFSNCQLRNSTTTCDAVRQRIIALQALSNVQLFNLAILAQMYSNNATELKEVLIKWLAQSADLLQKIASNQFLSTNDQNKRAATVAKNALSFAARELRHDPASAEMRRVLAEDLVRERLRP
jgi:hypothetical protein